MDQEAHRLLTSISCQYVSNRDLKLFTEGALTTCGRLFQWGTTRWLKKYFRCLFLCLRDKAKLQNFLCQRKILGTA